MQKQERDWKHGNNGKLLYDKKKILWSIEKILKQRDIRYLSHMAYQFIIMYCGSIAHYSLSGWQAQYSDLRDFVNFFLVKNEYGQRLDDIECIYNRNLNTEQRDIYWNIIALCKKYRDGIFRDLDKAERETSLAVAKALMQGELTVRNGTLIRPVEVASKFPQELTCDQLDEKYPNSKTFENFEEAQKFALDTGGSIYTQVDGEGEDVVYSRGNHLVNRTGVYAVILSS